MTDDVSEPADEPERTPEEAAPHLEAVTKHVGRDVLACFLDELKWAQDPWNKMPADRQDQVLRRAETRIKAAIRQGFAKIVAGDFVNVRASLDKVAFTVKGVQGTLSLAPGRNQAMELASHAGNAVIVVLSGADEFLERMGEVKGEADQPELFTERPRDPDLFDDSSTNVADGDGTPTPDTTVQDPGGPTEDPHPGELTAETVIDTLALVGIVADEATVWTWDQATRRAVVDYAGALHLAEGGHDVQVPERPSVLVEDEADDETEG